MEVVLEHFASTRNEDGEIRLLHGMVIFILLQRLSEAALRLNKTHSLACIILNPMEQSSKFVTKTEDSMLPCELFSRIMPALPASLNVSHVEHGKL